jgi:hypothetical protein
MRGLFGNERMSLRLANVASSWRDMMPNFGPGSPLCLGLFLGTGRKMRSQERPVVENVDAGRVM